MDWIVGLTGLGIYHEKFKALIEKLKYIHPANHPATMIIQDSTNQFVTKEQKTNWTNKLDADANAVSASKLNNPVKINGVDFDGTADITIYSKAEVNIQSFENELPSNQQTIKLDDTYELNEKSKVLLFVDGIKLVKDKHYTIDLSTKSISLKQVYKDVVNIEILIF